MFREDNWTLSFPSLLTANPSILFLGSSCDLRQACNPLSSSIRSDQQCTLQCCRGLVMTFDSRTLVLQHIHWRKWYKYFFHINLHWVWPINWVTWCIFGLAEVLRRSPDRNYLPLCGQYILVISLDTLRHEFEIRYVITECEHSGNSPFPKYACKDCTDASNITCHTDSSWTENFYFK